MGMDVWLCGLWWCVRVRVNVCVLLTASSSGSSVVLGWIELTRSPRRRDVTRGTVEEEGEAEVEAGGTAEDEEGVMAEVGRAELAMSS